MTDKTKNPGALKLDSVQESDDDEVDLLHLIHIILSSWKSILTIVILSTATSVVYSLLVPEAFKAEVLLASAQEEKSNYSGLNQFGGLAAMAGITIPNDSNTEQVVATLKSRQFLKRFILEKNLLPILFAENWDAKNEKWVNDGVEPLMQDAIQAFKGILSIEEDTGSGLITLSILWRDPNVAAEWANELVGQINEQLREKAILDSKKRMKYLEQELVKTSLKDMREVLYNLLESEKQKAMLANVNEDFALEVIDPAVAPLFRDKPKRKLIVILGGSCGILLGIILVFLRRFIGKLRAHSLEGTSL